MRISFLVLALLVQQAVFGQNRIFLNHVYQASNHFYTEDVAISETRVDLVSFDSERLSALFIKAVNAERNKRFRPELGQDSLLNRIALSGVQTYNKTRFVHSKTWKREKKNIRYALQHEHAANKIYAAHAFDLDMLDLKFAERLYFDPKPGTSEINLYLGNPPQTIDPESPDYVAPEPVEVVTERMICERLIKLLRKGLYRKDLLSKRFSRVGIALKLDKYSMNRSVRPRIFVVLIFGGKQLQDVEIPAEMKDENYTKLSEE